MDLERTKYMRDLRRDMVRHFDLDDLQTLAFDLAIDWDELKGEKKSTKTQSLLNHLAQQGRLEELLILLKEERANVSWTDIPRAEQQIEDQLSLNPDFIKLDQELFLKIKEILPSDGSVHFVRWHDYGGSFDRQVHKDLHKFIANLEKPEFEFFDSELDELRKRLAKTTQKFLQMIGKETFPLPGSDFNRIPRVYESEQTLRHRAKDDEHYEQIYEERSDYLENVQRTLNELADQIVKTYDEFIRIGRRKLAV